MSDINFWLYYKLLYKLDTRDKLIMLVKLLINVFKYFF